VARERYSVGERRIASILAAAEKHFSERGYQQTTLKMVAAEAGITDAGLMHYYPTKAHLLAAVSRKRSEASAWTWSQLPEPATLYQILGMMWWTTVLAQRESGLTEISVAAMSEGYNPYSPVHDEYAESFAEAVATTTKRFQRCIENGEIRLDVDPAVLARACFALGNGLDAQWVLDGHSFDLGDYLLASIVALSRTVATEVLEPDAAETRIREAAVPFVFATPA
jgi:AcrR family transcriptional regulator